VEQAVALPNGTNGGGGDAEPGEFQLAAEADVAVGGVAGRHVEDLLLDLGRVWLGMRGRRLGCGASPSRPNFLKASLIS